MKTSSHLFFFCMANVGLTGFTAPIDRAIKAPFSDALKFEIMTRQVSKMGNGKGHLAASVKATQPGKFSAWQNGEILMCWLTIV